MGNIYEKLAETKINRFPGFFNTRLVVEDCENIHLHYRNIRIEFSTEEFLKFAQVISLAADKLKRPSVEYLAIEQINPWDGGHRPGIKDKKYTFTEMERGHLDKIEIIKDAIAAGKRIRPILVKPVLGKEYLFQRQDGFCRWAAHHELGIKEIECIVDRRAPQGGQEGRSPIITDEEYEAITRGEIY